MSTTARSSVRAGLLGLGLLAGAPGRAATVDGTIITNIACATYMGFAGGLGFKVSYCATQTVLVANPCINLYKSSNPTQQSAGGTVTFTLYVVNCSCTVSAWNVTVTDRLPDNMSYNNPPAPAFWNGGSGGTWSPFMSSDNVTYAAGSPPAGQVTPYYLRFVLDRLGPCKSAMAQFTANIL